MADETLKRKDPTASEAMFFYAIVKHTKNKADIDWDSVAQEQGFKNAEVAKVRFGQVKRKLGIAGETAVTPRKPVVAPPASTPTKVRKAPAGRSGAKGKGKGRGSKVKKEESLGGENEGAYGGALESPTIKGDEREYMCKSEMDNDNDPF